MIQKNINFEEGLHQKILEACIKEERTFSQFVRNACKLKIGGENVE